MKTDHFRHNNKTNNVNNNTDSNRGHIKISSSVESSSAPHKGQLYDSKPPTAAPPMNSSSSSIKRQEQQQPQPQQQQQPRDDFVSAISFETARQDNFDGASEHTMETTDSSTSSSKEKLAAALRRTSSTTQQLLVNLMRSRNSLSGGGIIANDSNTNSSSNNNNNNNNKKTTSSKKAPVFEDNDDDFLTEVRKPDDGQINDGTTPTQNTMSWISISIVLVLLIGTISFGTIFIYIFTRQVLEKEQFESQFEDHAATILNSYQTNWNQAVIAMDTFSVLTLTLSGWPQVTVPNFELHAAVTKTVGKFSFLSLLPLVEERELWESFAWQNQGWIGEGLAYEQQPADQNMSPRIYTRNEQGEMSFDIAEGPFLPVWQHSPVDATLVNYNMRDDPEFGSEVSQALRSRKMLISMARSGEDDPRPTSTLYFPLVEKVQDQENSYTKLLRGTLSASMYWDEYFQLQELPETANDIKIVLRNQCQDQAFTFEVRKQNVVHVANEDTHDTSFNDLEQQAEQLPETISNMHSDIELDLEYCPYTVHVYPSQAMEDRFLDSKYPLLYTGFVLIMFLVTSLIFIGYGCWVRRRLAATASAIASSTVPDKDQDADESGTRLESRQERIKTFMDTRTVTPSTGNPAKGIPPAGASKLKPDIMDKKSTGPIAAEFSNSTVLFADICGFLAWTSARDPSQVFTLLEAVYGAFDKAADKRKVFTVETIGDCYVAAAGLPDPQPDHAVIMAKFAADIIMKMKSVTTKLASKLGPDTVDLSLRIGLNSGTVTAGVLRSKNSRFQLFGSTVHLASVMESCGEPDSIQCTKQTADILFASGKEHWLRRRDNIVDIKGKGPTQTFWVSLKSAIRRKSGTDSYQYDLTDNSDAISDDFSSAISVSDVFVSPPGKPVVQPSNFHRLVDWNVELMTQLLKKIVASRQSSAGAGRSNRKLNFTKTAANANGEGSDRSTTRTTPASDRSAQNWGNPRDEYVSCIPFQGSDNDLSNAQIESVELSEKVQTQLRAYVTKIASSYQTNPFHNFEHGCHVVMSINKILQRVNTSSTDSDEADPEFQDHMYKTVSDPMTQFACIFSALIHDVDHPGVPNGQLIRENDEMAALYDNKSVAENNSIDLAWGMLMDTAYSDFRRCIFGNDTDKKRFRQLLVNLVMATDLFDVDFKDQRSKCWEKSFPAKQQAPPPAAPWSTGGVGRTVMHDMKATAVMELFLQAADISHTMQNFHVYLKWNKKLFQEMHAAFHNGRLASDPTLGWYHGELWFFDNYIIPMAKKLCECGVLGTSGEEFLALATSNRREWQEKGQDIVKNMMRELGITATVKA